MAAVGPTAKKPRRKLLLSQQRVDLLSFRRQHPAGTPPENSVPVPVPGRALQRKGSLKLKDLREERVGLEKFAVELADRIRLFLRAHNKRLANGVLANGVLASARPGTPACGRRQRRTFGALRPGPRFGSHGRRHISNRLAFQARPLDSLQSSVGRVLKAMPAGRPPITAQRRPPREE